MYTNMASAMRVLTDWKFSAEVIANFVAQEIDIDQFAFLTEDDLKFLIPNIGPRRKFQNLLKQYLSESPEEVFAINTDNNKRQKIEIQEHYANESVIREREENTVILTEQYDENECAAIEQEEQNAVVATEQNNSVEENISRILSENTTVEYTVALPMNDNSTLGTKVDVTNKEYNLRNILQKSDEGLIVLRSYENESKFNHDLRNKLAKIIVSNELSSNINTSITSNRASFLSDQIKQLFPTEEKSVWYIKHKKGEAQGRGKILTKYYSTRRKLIKVGLISLKETDTYQDENDSDQNNSDNTECYEEYLLWLKNNSKPWTKVEEYWSSTSKKRLKALLNAKQPCHEYITQFPSLSDCDGYQLLEKDFETLHPGCNLKLYVAWPKLSAFVTEKVNPRAKNRLTKNALTPDGIKVATLSLLPYLFPVITVKRGKPRDWRPSREESEEGFLLHVKTIADLETRLQERSNKLYSFGLSCQPIAIIVGPTFDEISQCFIAINKYRYEVETPLKAIDLVLKSCNALNIQYPFEAGQVFMFLQRAVYSFETIWDRQKNSQLTTAVLAMIQEYKSC